MKETINLNEYRKDRIKRVLDMQEKIKNKIDITDNELLKSVNIRIPDNLYIDIKTLAAIKMTSISAIVETALKEYLENIK